MSAAALLSVNAAPRRRHRPGDERKHMSLRLLPKNQKSDQGGGNSMKNETIENVSRRSFLKTSGTLVLAASLPTMDIRALPRANAFNTSVYLDVAANGDITVTAHSVEMGQGIHSPKLWLTS